MKSYIFVGENRSNTAIAKGWTWKDGHLAAVPLFEALRACGIEPTEQKFANLWTDYPIQTSAERAQRDAKDHRTISMLTRAAKRSNVAIVAMGKRVSRGLSAIGIRHIAIVHPAARGKIRKRARYIAHVRDALSVVSS